MKKIFLYLLRKYSKTEKQRMEIYNELWNKVKEEYNEQTAFGNVYNMNVEIVMSNTFIQNRVILNDDDSLDRLRCIGIVSFNDAVEYIKKEKK